MFYKLPKQFIDGRIVMLDAAFDPSMVSDNYPGGPKTDASATDTTTNTDTTVDTTTQIPTLDYTGSWAADALRYIWDSSKNAITSFDSTNNEAVKSLDDLLNGTDIGTNYSDYVKSYLDQGFTTTEAEDKAASSLRNAIESSSLDMEQKDKAYSYLDTVITPSPENDPTSFDFFLKQFSETKEGQDILTNMYNGQTQYSQDQYNKLADEVTTQNGLLDSLLEQANTGTGVFSPITFSFGDINTTFVPRANRALATQMSELGQNKVNNLLGAFSSGLAVDKLNQDAYQFAESDKNVDQNREDNQPGVLDYVKGIATIANPVSGIISGIGDFLGGLF